MAKKTTTRKRKERDAPAFDGARFQEALHHRGLSHKDAARVLDVSDGLISKLVHNQAKKRDITTGFFGRIYRCVNQPGTVDVVSAAWLLGLDDKMSRRR